MRLYLAGPDVFRPDAKVIAARKKALCARYGFEGLDPIDQDAPTGLSLAETASAIFRANSALMRRADGIVADLSPFRGPSADPGTVFELGFMAGLGKPAFGYSTSAEPFLERTAAFCGVRGGDGQWRDADGLVIEAFGLRDNLMIDRALAVAGQEMVVPDRSIGGSGGGSADGGQDAAWCIERCLQAARDYFAIR